MQPVIEMRKVTKTYRGVPAVKNVDFTLHKGEVHALLGENGAGKSTLTKIMAGVVEATSGEMLHNGRQGQFRQPARGAAERHRHGVPGDEPRSVHDGGAEHLSRRGEVPQPPARHLHRGAAVPAVAELHVDPTATVATLGAAKRQMVEIARAVHHKADVIIFDEPTATLTPEEKTSLLRADAAPEGIRASPSSSSPTPSKRRSATPTASRILRDGELVETGAAARLRPRQAWCRRWSAAA